MSAADGDFVTPGNTVEIPADANLGSGLSETDSGAIALVSGTVVSNDGTISIEANMPSGASIRVKVPPSSARKSLSLLRFMARK